MGRSSIGFLRSMLRLPEEFHFALKKIRKPLRCNGVASSFCSFERDPHAWRLRCFQKAKVLRNFKYVWLVFSKTNYFLDRARQRGATYEGMKEFEKKINEKLKRGHLKVNVVFVPVPRDRLIPMLLEGKGDIAAAGLTITPERKEQVDFAAPLVENVDEIIVTGPHSPKVTRLEELSGKEIHVRKSSSYHESLIDLNKSFKKAGSPRVIIKEASEYLEDEDLFKYYIAYRLIADKLQIKREELHKSDAH